MTTSIERRKTMYASDLIDDKLKYVCENISRRGADTHFDEIYDLLFEYINDNIEKFLPEALHDDDL
jgi:hypothetical protein